MKDFFKQVAKYAFLLTVGGTVYVICELLYRGHSHWTMFLAGGICFILCGLLNEVIPWEMPLWEQMLICTLLITGVELVTGVILNLYLGLGIWDYSNVPSNVLGQICLPFCGLWFLISLPAIILDDYLRYWFFGEEKPHYTWR